MSVVVVYEGDIEVSRIEHRRESFANQLHDGIKLELLAQRLADVIDDGQLGVASVDL